MSLSEGVVTMKVDKGESARVQDVPECLSVSTVTV